MEYRDAIPSGIAAEPAAELRLEAPRQGVPEEEVERRVLLAAEEAAREAQQRFAHERQLDEQRRVAQIESALIAFDREKGEYFRSVEAGVVQLALSVAKKILQREAQLDPDLLRALVRMSLEKMQAGSSVKIRVHPEEAGRWQRICENERCSGWEISEDETMKSGDCLFETELGVANFGWDAQLQSVEESVENLLGQRRSSI